MKKIETFAKTARGTMAAHGKSEYFGKFVKDLEKHVQSLQSPMDVLRGSSPAPVVVPTCRSRGRQGSEAIPPRLGRGRRGKYCCHAGVVGALDAVPPISPDSALRASLSAPLEAAQEILLRGPPAQMDGRPPCHGSQQ
jgi:hypothetical protein